MNFTPADVERLTSYLQRDTTTGCLIFTGFLGRRGYGTFWLHPKPQLAHRVAWVMAGGLITPEKPYILHNCPGGDNTSCCEPTHLWAGTYLENQRDKAAKGRGTKSKRGFPYGVSLQRSGRFRSTVSAAGAMHGLGTFDTWQEASALALLAKNLYLATPPAVF